MKRKREARLFGVRKNCKKEIACTTQRKYSFPYRSIDFWKGLKEDVIMAKNVQNLKEKVGNIDMETRLDLCSSGPVYYS